MGRPGPRDRAERDLVSHPESWPVSGRGGETELLFPYACHFKSKAGELWASHFATVVEGQENLKELGRMTLWEGAQPISLRRAKTK